MVPFREGMENRRNGVLVTGQAASLVLSHLLRCQAPIAVVTNDHKPSGLNKTNAALYSSGDPRSKTSLVSSVTVLAALDSWRL